MRIARGKGDGAGDGQGEGHGGAGMAASMLYGRRIWVLRPFLGLARAEIRSFLQARGVSWIDDPSNANPAFERVRVRARIATSGGMPTPLGNGRQRAASSARAAALIEKRIRVHEALVAEVSARHAGEIDDPDWRRALLTVASVLGGREHMPAFATVQRLSQFLRSGEPGRMTAGRVVFDRRASGLYLYREARNLPVLAVGPGRQGAWDGRFTVKSRGPAVTVAADASGRLWTKRLIDAGLPAGIAKRGPRWHQKSRRRTARGSPSARLRRKSSTTSGFTTPFCRVSTGSWRMRSPCRLGVIDTPRRRCTMF